MKAKSKAMNRMQMQTIKTWYAQKNDEELAKMTGLSVKKVADFLAQNGLKRNNYTLKKLGMNINEIEVIDPEVIDGNSQ